MYPDDVSDLGLHYVFMPAIILRANTVNSNTFLNNTSNGDYSVLKILPFLGGSKSFLLRTL